MSEKKSYFYSNHNTILLADRDTASYMLISELLSEYNISVLHAKCGASALEILMKNVQIALVFTEIQLSVLDGFELLEKVREINPTIPVIAQTACNLYGIKQKCIRSGFNNYILKPIDLDLFIAITKEYLLLSTNKS